MKLTHTLPLLLLALCILAAPAAAEDTTAATNPLAAYYNTPLDYHPLGLTLSEIRAGVASVVSDATIPLAEKLEAQTIVLGMDDRLAAWLSAERDEETGEPIYGTHIPVLSPILEALGIWDKAVTNPYTEAEGQAAWNQYVQTYVSEYKPTGTFGGPIT